MSSPNLHAFCRSCGSPNPPQGPFCDLCTSQLEVPAGVRIFRIYATIMVAVYALTTFVGLGILGFSFFSLVNPLSMLHLGGDDLAGMFVQGGISLLIGPSLMALFLVALKSKRKPWLYGVHMVCIALGLTSCLSIFMSLPLIILYTRPGPKQYLMPLE